MTSAGCFVVAYLSSFVACVCDVNVAQHVDIDAVRASSSRSPTHMQYLKTIEKGRTLLRTLEAACQCLYDDAAALLSSIQSLEPQQSSVKEWAVRASNLSTVIATNLAVVMDALDALLALGSEQANLEQSTYNGAIEWRRSRPSMFFGDSDVDFGSYQNEEDVVDMELAFSRQGGFRTVPPAIDSSSTLYNNSSQHESDTSLDMSDRSRSDGVGEPVTPTWAPHESSDAGTLVAATDADVEGDAFDDENSPLFDDEGRKSS